MAVGVGVKRCRRTPYVTDVRDFFKQLQVQMEDCGVCYTNEPKCKLVCGHAFCYQCVKNWYQKSEDPSCPMCRGSLYFRNMRCHTEKWENERIDLYNEECFNNALEEIFDEDELEFYGPDDILWQIEELQKRYHTFLDTDYDMAEVLEALEEEIATASNGWIWDDIDDTGKNLFVTKHKTQRRKSRNGTRVLGKHDGPLNIECLIIFV